ncbi:acyl-CoA dehydrogenase family protein [Sphingomonas jeddahensis]|uniref:Acyl-CoA dehydrogenase n=1 Tax=Sphingomonas jeddahensis TaxID=1915074 RepID=A0A1V2EYH1_9SPHN|nr:acyl-CoA dehydrogenase family protein [Sphingomonas jeddahensis]ONF97722.1 Acyl-CoA dehydrogenase [Sphingomonas jeddahensis]
MNFDDTPEEAAFRAEARAWIDANAPKHLHPILSGSGFGTSAEAGEIDMLAEAKKWQKAKRDAGWACLHWPKEYGGRGASPMERVIWNQEEGVYAQLSFTFIIGQGMCGPTVMAWGSEEDKQRLLPPLAAGEDIWCQMFSEPAAGSDLAGLRTRAVQDGDEWVVNGSKIWTSGAHISQYGILLTRTDPTVAKHKGLTMFWVDMRSPGIEVRPILQAHGQSGFNEVFFTDLRIPDSQRLGAVGNGWNVSLTTLMNERLSIGSGMSTGFEPLLDYATRAPGPSGGRLVDDPSIRSKLADWATKASGLKYTSMRALTALSKGEQPGPENSIGKLVAGSTMQDIAMFALDQQGEMGVLTDPELAAHAARFQQTLMRSPATRIEGGTDEILRNIIAERVLGLPGDVRVDKDVPFEKIPTRA